MTINTNWLLIALVCLLTVAVFQCVGQMSYFNTLIKSRIYLPSPAKFGVVPLTNDRFAVVDGDSTSVYHVDKGGNTHLLSHTP